MDIKALLKKWNGGDARGAPRRLAEAAEVSESVMSRFLRGYPNALGEAKQERVAAILKVTVEELRAAVRRPPAPELREPSQEYGDTKTTSGYEILSVPYVGLVSASQLSQLFSLPKEDFVTVAVTGPKGSRYAVLEVGGKCMEPEIPDGSRVVVRETDHAENGDIAIVCWDGDCEMRWFYRTKNGIELVPDNPAFDVITIKSSKARVIAVVSEITRKPRRRRR
jgi:SOS-response transcriptional repressor LexA